MIEFFLASLSRLPSQIAVQPKGLARLFLVFFLILTGCVLPNQSYVANPHVNQADIPFNASGRLSVMQENHHLSANFRWKHAPPNDEVDINTPLGNTIAQIQRNASGVTLRAGSEVYHADDVDSLTQNLLGFPLPLAHLSWWLRGQSAPNIEVQQQEKGILQAGWTIDFYTDEQPNTMGFGINYPRRVDLSREAIRLRFVTHEWQALEN
ncbi:MAG: lipoprotein insertase outer membrane protein LolB [Neisseriaceae bacterium]|nr:lipoprotein insertase outer membrane protein LolB [Neisseriaceae bacterium]